MRPTNTGRKTESEIIAEKIKDFEANGGKIQVIERRVGDDLNASVKRATSPSYSNNSQLRKIAKKAESIFIEGDDDDINEREVSRKTPEEQIDIRME